MSIATVRIPDMEVADVHAVLLALAVLSLQRPGWLDYLSRIARDTFQGSGTFEEFRRLNADVVKPL